MNVPDSLRDINFSSPVNARIEVKGKLDKNLSEYLCGLKITNLLIEKKTRISRLEGEITDQAALMGVLNTLYNMRFPIINVMVKQ